MTRQISNVTRQTRLSSKSTDRNKKKKFPPPPSQKENNSQNQQASNGQTYEQQTEQPSKNVCLLSYSVLTLKMSTSSAVLPLNLRACHRSKTLPLHCLLTLTNQELIPRILFNWPSYFIKRRSNKDKSQQNLTHL